MYNLKILLINFIMASNYIYVRDHLAYKFNNAVKIGCTTNLGTRDMAYATGEISRGKFIKVFRIINILYSPLESIWCW